MGRLWILALVLAGCYDEPSIDCTIRCTPADPASCPDGLTCNSEGLCSVDGAACAAPSIDFRSIGAGARHACGLSSAGDVYCWGGNDLGQVGAGSMGDPITNVTKVTGTSGPYKLLAVGAEHTCALDNAGHPWCWGQNAYGQVRGAGPVPFPTPTAVLGSQAPAFDQLSAGGYMTCGLGAGQLWCWGPKELTGGTQQSEATRIGMLDDWTQIDAGVDHVCGISTSMGALCFGRNGYMQLGTTDRTDRATPTQVSNLPARTPLVIAAGTAISCAIMGDAGATAGSLWCWGRNSYGLVIIDTSGQEKTATQIGTDSDWTDIVLGHYMACGKRAGTWRCWGDSYDGAIPSGLWDYGSHQVDEAAEVGPADELTIQLQGGDGDDVDVLCLRNGTKVSCSGDNSYGQLATGNYSRHGTPVEVIAPSNLAWKHLDAGHHHSCATTTDDTLLCWGGTYYGQANAGIALGEDSKCVEGEVCDIASPTPMTAPLARADDFLANEEHSCLRDGSTVHCWGGNFNGYLGGNASTGVSTVAAPGGAMWTSIFGGDTVTCGQTTTGSAACWGKIAGTLTSPPVPLAIQPVNGGGFGNGFACVTNTSTERKCWGNNLNGELGSSDQSTTHATPGSAFTASGVSSISSAGNHSCVITTGNNVNCFGTNTYFESGSPSTSGFETSPVSVKNSDGDLTNCTRVSAGEVTGCAVCDGKVYCWGDNYRAQLGRGDSGGHPDSVAALVMLPATETWVDVSAGSSFGCALSMTGRLFCWGDSRHGELGIGAQSKNLLTPIAP